MTGKPAFSGRRGALWSRRLTAGVCALLLGFQTGCYTLMPMQLEMPTGVERVGVVLNDRGRFQMGSVLGPATDVVEGAIARQDSTQIELNVYRVVTLRGETSTWTGESVVIQRDGISGFRERRLSKARSWMLAGAFVGALVLSFFVLGLDGLGADESPEPCVGPTCNPNPSIRW